jgi:hypothetical protein
MKFREDTTEIDWLGFSIKCLNWHPEGPAEGFIGKGSWYLPNSTSFMKPFWFSFYVFKQSIECIDGNKRSFIESRTWIPLKGDFIKEWISFEDFLSFKNDTISSITRLNVENICGRRMKERWTKTKKINTILG